MLTPAVSASQVVRRAGGSAPRRPSRRRSPSSAAARASGRSGRRPPRRARRPHSARTMSRDGSRREPAKSSPSQRAFSSGSPPDGHGSACRGSPASSGRHAALLGPARRPPPRRPASRPSTESSSRPSRPCTTQARCVPSRRSAPAISCARAVVEDAEELALGARPGWSADRAG